MARCKICTPYTFQFESYVTGHHIYKDIWTPVIGEKLVAELEPDNLFDKHVVKVIKDDKTVGHIPKEHSRNCSAALSAGGKNKYEVTGRRENRRNNGLEVACKYIVTGPMFLIPKLEQNILEYVQRTNKK